MTSGDMKIELNENREVENTIPVTYINPGAYDRNIGEIEFEDPDLVYGPDEVLNLNDTEEEDYSDDPPKRFR